uniref:Secreted protein n=1 Tax=Varanus komodoensis TaxID=61221 RepID=A0A8D2L4S7_VARKO
MSMRSEMKSRWNWGSITCIMCLIWGGSQRSMSSSRASSFSGPLQCCGKEPRSGDGVSHRPHLANSLTSGRLFI